MQEQQLKKVVVDLEPLPEYMSYLEAVKPEAERIHDSFDNIYSTQPVLKGDYDHVAEMIDNAPYAVDGSFYSSESRIFRSREIQFRLIMMKTTSFAYTARR
ncbi:MAG: hypothetical protein V8R14_06240 [Clostridia bacterium]